MRLARTTNAVRELKVPHHGFLKEKRAVGELGVIIDAGIHDPRFEGWSVDNHGAHSPDRPGRESASTPG